MKGCCLTSVGMINFFLSDLFYGIYISKILWPVKWWYSHTQCECDSCKYDRLIHMSCISGDSGTLRLHCWHRPWAGSWKGGWGAERAWRNYGLSRNLHFSGSFSIALRSYPGDLTSWMLPQDGPWMCTACISYISGESCIVHCIICWCRLSLLLLVLPLRTRQWITDKCVYYY